ncbi:MAG: hypothetical protein K0U98_13610 [Deltaproteobacteria bacterium]|nr:hypothetical protein [Deltaproteobacteria bacterium]
MENLVSSWDGEAVISHFDKTTGTWMFIALHSSVLGIPTGGTRLRTYSRPAEGLRDAMRLGEGMTHKWAALGLAMGGGKAVLAVPGAIHGDDRRGLLLRYGQLVQSLRGAFGTGEDLGISPQDMAVIAEATEYVHGTRQDGGVTDPGPLTARGVFEGIRAAVNDTLDLADLQGVRVLVQGAGDVGVPLCQHLAEAGATLFVADPDPQRLTAAKERFGAQEVDSEAAYATECEVFAPCAIGAVLNSTTIPQLRCRIVAGSANNQLAEADDAARLHERGIVYAPDYVINGGGALAFARYSAGEHDLDRLMELMDEVGISVGSLLREARQRRESPATTSLRRVEERLRQG